MLPTIALTLLLAAPTPNGEYSSSVKGGEVHFIFTDTAHMYGPFKFYVSADGCPGAGCATCPDGVSATYCVPPEMVYQKWLGGNHGVDVSFPLSAVGGMENFYFTAVTVRADDECYHCSGVVPHANSTRGK